MDRRSFLLVSSLAALTLTGCSNAEPTPTKAGEVGVQSMPLATAATRPAQGWTGSVVTWDAEDSTSAVTVGINARTLKVNRITESGAESTSATATPAQLELLGKTTATLEGKQPSATPGSGLAASMDLTHTDGTSLSYAASDQDPGYALIVALVKALTTAS